MNELTIGPGDEASLSMGTLMGDMEGGGRFTGDFEGNVQKILETRLLLLQGPVGEPVELLTIFGGLQIGSISLCGSSVREAPF